MVNVITDEEVASVLQVAVTPGLTLIVQKTNALITENWENPPSGDGPVPTRVWALALEIASRAITNPKRLTSMTRSWDDITRTERQEGDILTKLGLYITEDEIASLNGVVDPTPAGVGTIRTRTWDEACSPPRRSPC